MTRRPLSDKRVREIAGGYSLTHDVESVPLAEEVLEARADRRAYNETSVRQKLVEPLAMLLWCPECGERHIDVGEFATKSHHTHACQHCGHVWRPAIGPTCGVRFLPGFKNEEPAR